MVKRYSKKQLELMRIADPQKYAKEIKKMYKRMSEYWR